MRHLSPASLQRWSADDLMFTAQSQNATLRIIPFSPEIIRIIWSRPGDVPTPWQPAASPKVSPWQILEDELYITLTTSALTLRLDKANCLLTLLDNKGLIINEDHPTLGILWMDNLASCQKKLRPKERFIGLGEKTGNLDRRGSSYIHWNRDAFAYGIDSDPLYCSIPFYIGLHEAGCYGIFLASTAKSEFDFGASNDRFVSFSTETGELDYFYIFGNEPLEILNHFTWLTGRPYLPPIWSLGFQQCRYSYYPEAEVLAVANHFRQRKIPCDVLYYDIHYMSDFKVFSWDKTRFPDPARLNAHLLAMGFHSVAILDPGIKKQPGYRPYDTGIEADIFIQYPDGEPYTAEVWPGVCLFPDFGNRHADQWWASFFPELIEQGISGFWNDMNEPAVWGQTVPKMLIHRLDTGTYDHRQVHNLYGYLMAKATHLAGKEGFGGLRPFVLSRAGFAGIQQWAAMWTGDNVATDEHFLLGVRLVNSLGMSGVTFSGFDIGGFVGEASPALFMRWISTAAFVPFFRMHTMINSRDSEPWSYGEEAEEVAKNYICFRYRLLPTLYSLFYLASQTGAPVMRSLALHYYQDQKIFELDFQNQFLVGETLLVCPLESTQKISKIYLPEGQWYSLYNDEIFVGGVTHLVESPPEKLPVFVKAGGILLLQQPTQHTGELPNDKTLQIHVYQGETGSSFTYYEDDGLTYEFEYGEFCLRNISYHPKNQELILSPCQGIRPSRYEKVAVYYHAKNSSVGERLTDFRFFEPISRFDPFYQKPDSYGSIPVVFRQLTDWSAGEMRFSLA